VARLSRPVSTINTRVHGWFALFQCVYGRPTVYAMTPHSGSKTRKLWRFMPVIVRRHVFNLQRNVP